MPRSGRTGRIDSTASGRPATRDAVDTLELHLPVTSSEPSESISPYFGEGEVVPLAARRTPRQKRQRTLGRDGLESWHETGEPDEDEDEETLVPADVKLLFQKKSPGTDDAAADDFSGQARRNKNPSPTDPSPSAGRGRGGRARGRGSGRGHSSASGGRAASQSEPTPTPGKRKKLSSRVSRRMLVEEQKAGEEDRLLERAKLMPYDFTQVPGCERDLSGSVVLRIASRRMCTYAIAEMFHMCNEAARRGSIRQPAVEKPSKLPATHKGDAKRGPVHPMVQSGGLNGAKTRSTRSSPSVGTIPVPVSPKHFETGEIIQCPKCKRNMKAPTRAPALRCANCKSEIHPKHRKYPGILMKVPDILLQRKPGAANQPQPPRTSAQLRAQQLVAQPQRTEPEKNVKVEPTKKTTKPEPRVPRKRQRQPSQAERYDKPLSLDYIADRLDIDNPLNGFMIRQKKDGWLQGFILITHFTTWQRWFRWDSLAPQAGLVEAAQKGTLTHWDSDGKITNALEQQKRSGDPEKEGVIWPRIAELSLLGALRCGGYLLRLALDEMEEGNDYDFLILQATDKSRPFYEKMGFVRVGAVARYVPPGKKVAETPVLGYRHWTFSDEPEERMPEPSYMMAKKLARKCAGKSQIVADLDKVLVTRVPKIKFQKMPQKAPSPSLAASSDKGNLKVVDNNTPRNYVCEECGADFKRACELGNHLRGHARAKGE